MRRVSLEQVQPGMIIARTIFGSGGQILLNAGTEYKDRYSQYLKKLGINSLYIQDSRLEGIVIEDVVSDKTRLEAKNLVKEIIDGSKNSSKEKPFIIKDTKISQTVEKIIDEILTNKDIIINLVDIKSASDYTFSHSVNVAVLSILTAIKMDLPPVSLKKIAIGALLHDIGMMSVPENILNKPSQLTQNEKEIVMQHSLYGYEMFKKSPLFSSIAGSILSQHHERFNGEGYPMGVKGNKITTLSQIVSVCDVYDSLISDRPYRKAYNPHEALEMISAMADKEFNIDVLRVFLSFVAAYPVGSHVMLNNGDSGLVIDNTPGFSMRPVVKVLYQGERMAIHPDPYKVDLTEVLDLVIVKLVE